MNKHSWVDGFPGAVTVCDADGVITEMNKAAEEVFKNDGGAELIGHSVLDCHPEPARSRLKEMMETQTSNVYTIEKGGKWKIVYQSPVYNNGQYAGFVELSMEIPAKMPHFIRKSE